MRCVAAMILCFTMYSFESDSDLNLEPTGYMRREYSLIKPFHGKLYFVTYHKQMNTVTRYFLRIVHLIVRTI